MHFNHTKKNLTSYHFGIISEFIAIIILLFKGYKILHHRYKNKSGEIDIIAKKFNIIIFIEVKSRKNKIFLTDLLDNKQITRIKNCAEIFIVKNQSYLNFKIRYDLITFNKNFLARHFKNFF